jgi:hypothetical protein
MWSYDKLSDRLIVKNVISLELEEDCIFAVVPKNSDIKAAEKRCRFPDYIAK